LAVSQRVYVDRKFEFTAVPDRYLGREYIRTANDDKSNTAADYLTLTLAQPATVYVLYDQRATQLPAWLSGWSLLPDTIDTHDGPRRIYSQAFPAGTVTLGGNAMAPMSGARSAYAVVVEATHTVP
jgi:hypothetical protein